MWAGSRSRVSHPIPVIGGGFDTGRGAGFAAAGRRALVVHTGPFVLHAGDHELHRQLFVDLGQVLGREPTDLRGLGPVTDLQAVRAVAGVAAVDVGVWLVVVLTGLPRPRPGAPAGGHQRLGEVAQLVAVHAWASAFAGRRRRRPSTGRRAATRAALASAAAVRRTSRRRQAIGVRTSATGMPRRISSARWLARPASIAGAITGTSRVEVEVIRPWASRVCTVSSRCPARSPNRERSAASLQPPKTSTAAALLRIMLAPLSPHRWRSCPNPWQAACTTIERLRSSA